jgi:hypothetical protein
MPGIDQFKANFSGGGARANQFKVYLNFPTLVDKTSSAARKSEFLCEAASLPGSDLQTLSVSHKARSIEIPVGRTVHPWRVSILNDTDFDVHNAIESWMNLINGVKTNQGVTNPLAYTSQLEVYQLNRDGGILKKYKMVDAWPTSMSKIDLAWSNNSKVETFDVTFAHSYWEEEMGLGLSVTIKGFTFGT